MKKIVDWINSHKVITVCIVLFLLVVQPFFVHLFLKLPAPSPFLERDWSAGDLLTYIAGFEAFIGTVFLGIVAVRQNDKANEMNNRMLENVEIRDAFERQPYLMINNWDIQSANKDGEIYIEVNPFAPRNSRKEVYAIDNDTYQVIIELVNISKVFLSMIVEKMDIVFLSSPFQNLLYDRDYYDKCKSVFNIASGDFESICFLIDKEGLFSFGPKLCTLTIKLLNSLGETYIETITFMIEVDSDRVWLEPVSYRSRQISQDVKVG